MEVHVLADCPRHGPFQTGVIVGPDPDSSVELIHSTSFCPVCGTQVLIPDGTYSTGPFGLIHRPPAV